MPKHINETTNATEVKTMTPEERQFLDLEKMRYNNNSLSYKLGFGGIACSIIACSISLNSLQPTTFMTVLAILMNIIVLLFGFLATEKVKVYNLSYNKHMFVLGGVCIARIFWYPLLLIKNFASFKSSLDANGYQIAAATKAASKINASILSAYNEGAANPSNYLWANGYTRGIIIIVFLGLAAACFILSGLVNLKKGTALKKHLETVVNYK